MKPQDFYKAYLARDARFDGIFFVGVKTTGIYCRPVCPAKTPKEQNCNFFSNTAAAEQAGFRPCLRCRPELAPGYAPIDATRRMANLIADSLVQYSSTDGFSLESLAHEFNLSSRQVRRIIHNEFGVSPLELITSKRLLLAKKLLTETTLPVTQLAYASGFSSLRRFNAAFLLHYKMSPSQLRKNISQHLSAESTTLQLQLNYRLPYAFANMLNFLNNRAIRGAESVIDNSYLRTVQIAKHSGWIKVQNNSEKNCLELTLSTSLVPVLSTLLLRLRSIFDLNARPDLIMDCLSGDPLLADIILKYPGLRVPGAFDQFEISVRAILGQQITVKAATTLASRFLTAFGTPVETPFAELNYLFPSAKRIACVTVDEIAALGIIQSRAKSIIILAQEIASGRLKLDSGADHEMAMTQLVCIPGIGKWTAHYIAMRALRYPDAFPKEDVILRKNLGGVTAKQAEELSQKWRPWRSYATLYLWQLHS